MSAAATGRDRSQSPKKDVKRDRSRSPKRVAPPPSSAAAAKDDEFTTVLKSVVAPDVLAYSGFTMHGVMKWREWWSDSFFAFGAFKRSDVPQMATTPEVLKIAKATLLAFFLDQHAKTHYGSYELQIVSDALLSKRYASRMFDESLVDRAVNLVPEERRNTARQLADVLLMLSMMEMSCVIYDFTANGVNMRLRFHDVYARDVRSYKNEFKEAIEKYEKAVSASNA